MNAPDLSPLERLGLSALSSGAATWPDEAHAVGTLDAKERAELRNIERHAVWRAGIAGALSAGVMVAVIILFRDLESSSLWKYWGLVGGIGAAAAVVEISFLYWDALRSVRRMARTAGLGLVDDQRPDEFVTLALARAALELPTPSSNSLHVDPLRETSRAQLVLASLVYKSKIAVTSFLLRLLLRRALGRVVARAALEAVAVPVTALWNVYVCRKVLREARLRVMGPALAARLATWVQEPLQQTAAGEDAAEQDANVTNGDRVENYGAKDNAKGNAIGNGFEAEAAPSWNADVQHGAQKRTRAGLRGERLADREAHVRQVTLPPKVADAPKVAGETLALWAVGTAFVKNRKVHPNVQALVRAMGSHEPPTDAPDLGDCPRFLRALKAADAPARRAALRALVAAAILDGKVTRIEREWLDVVFTVAGARAPLPALHEACARFVRGEGFDASGFDPL